MKTWILLLSIIFSCSAQGALLDLTPNQKSIEKVPTHSAAIETFTGTKRSFSQKGAALRSKKVLMIKVKVYVAEYFKSESGDQAMRLQFLRDVDAEKVMNSFKDALTVNAVDLQQMETQAFLKAVTDGGEAKEQTAMTILSINHNGNEYLIYEGPSGKRTDLKVPAGFGQKIFSIWLGKPADEDLADMKKAFSK